MDRILPVCAYLNLNYFTLQPQAREKAESQGFEISIAKTSFKANTKALAENEGEGLAKVCLLYLLFTAIQMCENITRVVVISTHLIDGC